MLGTWAGFLDAGGNGGGGRVRSVASWMGGEYFWVLGFFSVRDLGSRFEGVVFAPFFFLLSGFVAREAGGKGGLDGGEVR